MPGVRVWLFSSTQAAGIVTEQSQPLPLDELLLLVTHPGMNRSGSQALSSANRFTIAHVPAGMYQLPEESDSARRSLAIAPSGS